MTLQNNRYRRLSQKITMLIAQSLLIMIGASALAHAFWQGGTMRYVASLLISALVGIFGYTYRPLPKHYFTRWAWGLGCTLFGAIATITLLMMEANYGAG